MILAIETSCDESAVALIDEGVGDERPRIVSERINSQIALHAQYGGVVPELAAREHLKALPALVDDLITQERARAGEGFKLSKVAVTVGPGLKGSLLMGVNFAKGYGFANDIPVVGINHIEGHLLSPLIDRPELKFPYLGVVVSGGHTEIHEVRGVGDYELIERTVDDAAGEAFDKCAALLGIAYPGGAKLAQLADSYGDQKVDFKVSASKSGLSFSGLKTSFRMLVEKAGLRAHNEIRSEEELAKLAHYCAAAQTAIVETLKTRVAAALEATQISQIGLSGGVAANSCLRRELSKLASVYAVPNKWCGDNAAMIGFVAALRGKELMLRAQKDQNCDTSIRARWPVEEMSFDLSKTA